MTTTLLNTVAEIGPLLAQHTEEEAQQRRLSRPVFNALAEAGFHKLFLPKSLGGLEVDPLTAAKLVEEVASYNTAAGWSLMVGNTTTWWSARLTDEGAEEVFRNNPGFLAGTIHPPMMAVAVDGGFRITGRSPLASNVHEAKYIFTSALIFENNQPKFTNGMPEVIGAYMKADDCDIIDTWHTLGMKATDSNDIVAENVFVPNHLYFRLMPDYIPNQYYEGPLYKYAPIGASVTCLIAPIALAVASNAIKELKALAAKKVPMGSQVSIRERGTVQRKLGIAEAQVQSSRAYLHTSISTCWNKVLSGEKLSLEDKAGLLLAATHTNQSCLSAIDAVYSAAGTSAIYTRNKMSQYFTDAQVIRQHGFVNDSRYETVGQVYMGMQPDLGLLGF